MKTIKSVFQELEGLGQHLGENWEKDLIKTFRRIVESLNNVRMKFRGEIELYHSLVLLLREKHESSEVVVLCQSSGADVILEYQRLDNQIQRVLNSLKSYASLPVEAKSNEFISG